MSNQSQLTFEQFSRYIFYTILLGNNIDHSFNKFENFYRWNFTSTDFKYVVYDIEYEISKWIVTLSDTEIFFHSRHAVGSYSMDLIKAEFTDSSYTELWRHSIACQTAGCNYGISTSAIDANTNSLWHTLAFDDKILFINQDISTGVQVGSRYMLSSSQTS